MNHNEAKVSQFLRDQATPTLISSLRTLEGLEKQSGHLHRELKGLRTWIVSELERRHPQAAEAVETAFHEAELEADRTGNAGPHVDYAAVLIDAIPASER